jgi:hypothetical protein
MNTAAADRIAKAVLYEGYMLYPYRPSAVKNQQRFNFGVVYPQIFSEAQKGTDAWTMSTECLLQGALEGKVEVQVRFLQLVERSVEEATGRALDSHESAERFSPVKTLTIDDHTHYSWQEAVECQIDISSTDVASLLCRPVQRPFLLAASTTDEALRDSRGVVRGRIVRSQHAIEGSVYLAVHQVADIVFKVVVRVKNITSLTGTTSVSRDYGLTRSLVSAHVVLGAENGEFVSSLDPPEALRAAAADCHNQGVYPVLVGDEGSSDTMLASPIILYDYPQIAPESAGDLFDGTEIDEILSLRILTMTDDEKREMRESDERARQMLERTENMPEEQFAKLHGALRGLRPLNKELR